MKNEQSPNYSLQIRRPDVFEQINIQELAVESLQHAPDYVSNSLGIPKVSLPSPDDFELVFSQEKKLTKNGKR